MPTPVSEKPCLYPLGTRIRRLRKSLNMTQTQLALAAGIQASLVSIYERDRENGSVPNLARIAKALGTTVAYLIQGDE